MLIFIEYEFLPSNVSWILEGMYIKNFADTIVKFSVYNYITGIIFHVIVETLYSRYAI